MKNKSNSNVKAENSSPRKVAAVEKQESLSDELKHLLNPPDDKTLAFWGIMDDCFPVASSPIPTHKLAPTEDWSFLLVPRDGNFGSWTEIREDPDTFIDTLSIDEISRLLAWWDKGCAMNDSVGTLTWEEWDTIGLLASDLAFRRDMKIC
jgi:hypothetical protein